MRETPHNIEAEQSVLSGCLNGLRVDIDPDDFYRAAHRTIYRVASFLWNRGIEPDLVTIVDRLRQAKKLEEVGGASYLSQIDTQLVSSQEAIDRYAEIIKRCSLSRKLATFGAELQERALEGEAPDELLSSMYAQLGALGATGKSGFIDYNTLIHDAVKRAEARTKNPQAVHGVPTPFSGLNKMTGGLQREDLVIIAGRPSMGKTAIAQSIANHVGAESGPVLIFSLEMSKDSLGDRSLSMEARVENQDLRSGFIQDRAWPRIVRAAGHLSRLPIYVDDTPGRSAEQIVMAARKMQGKHELSLIVVDYLQLIRPGYKGMNRDQEVGEITRMFKLCARELKVPFVLLCQLNRSCEAREDKRPLLADLRESGNIEQDADLIMFVYRDEVYYPESAFKGTAELIVRKQRNGPLGTVRLIWINKYTRFENLAVGEPDGNIGDEVSVGADSEKQPEHEATQMSLLPDEPGR